MKNIRIVCAADLHLGRRLASLPEGLEEFAHAPKESWRSLVAFVSDPMQQVDALILAGDVFDSELDLYEAIGIFEEGVRKVLARGIPIIAVAGNHDAHVLKKCHLRISSPAFYLLGENAAWEIKTFVFHGREISFAGFSFARPKCTVNPLLTFEKTEKPVTIGILHCDVTGGKESEYAPVELRNFKELPVRAWVLGHIHIPEILLRDPLVFYCGSLQGLDPTEQGLRGASFLEILPTQEIVRTFVPLAPFLWSLSAVDFSGEDKENLDETLCIYMQRHLQNIPESVKVVMSRIVFQGRSAAYRQLQEFAQRIKGRHFTQVGAHGAPCYIEDVSITCTPDVDLEALCKGRDLAGLMAGLVRMLETNGKPREALLQEAHAYLSLRMEKNGYLKRDEQILEEELVSAGYEILDKILMQEEG